MRKLFPARKKSPGLSPGSLIHVGQKKSEMVKISFMDYNASGHFAEGEVTSIGEITSIVDPASVTWINVAGLHQVEVIEVVGQRF